MLFFANALAEGEEAVVEAVTEAATEVVEAAATNSNLNITVGDALLYAVVGFALVFVALFIIIGAIVITSKVVANGTKKTEQAAAKTPVAEAPAAPKATAPGSCGELKLYNVSDKDAAMIMAIVADEMKTPLNELRFISIKEVA